MLSTLVTLNGFLSSALKPPPSSFILSDCKLKNCLICLSTCSCKRRNLVGNSPSLPICCPLLCSLSEAFHLTVGGGAAPGATLFPAEEASQVVQQDTRLISVTGACAWLELSGVCLQASVSDSGTLV